MFTKRQPQPIGDKLTAHLEASGLDLRLQSTYVSGEIHYGPASPTTTKWTILRLFVDKTTGDGKFYLEYWEHDNGYRADWQQISSGEAKHLLRREGKVLA